MPATVKRNLFYQLIFQAVKIAIPFITVPIISNALGAEGIGIYSFTSSIAEYFILLAGIGILLYGNREVAMVRDEPEKLNQLFSELVVLKAIMTLLMLVAYWFVVRIFLQTDLRYYAIHLITISSVFFDITWLFMGLEQFKRVSLINTFLQIGVFFLIIWKVRTPDDLVFYMVVKALGEWFGFSLIWLYAMKQVRFRKVTLTRLAYHLKKTMLFFIPQVGVVLYTTLTKTLLGFLTTTHDVGVYTNSMNLIVTFTTLLSTIDLVLLPRMSHLFANKKLAQLMEILSASIHIQLFLTIPAAFGIAGIARSVVPWFFGTTFSEMTGLLPVLAPIIVMMPFGLVLSRQYLLPLGKTGLYTLSVMGGAVISALLSFLLIPRFGLMGAAISTVIVESVITLYRASILMRQQPQIFQWKLIGKLLVAGTGMFAAVWLYGQANAPTPLTTIIQILLGILTYGILAFLLKVPYLFEAFEYVTAKWTQLKTQKSKSSSKSTTKSSAKTSLEKGR